MLVYEVVLINYFFRVQDDGNLVVLIFYHDVLKVKFFMLTARHLEPGVNMTLFQCIFEVVRLDVRVDTGPSKLSLSPLTASCTMFVSFLWVKLSQKMKRSVTLASWGTSCLCMKKQVLVPCMSPIPWKSCPISFNMTFLHLIF